MPYFKTKNDGLPELLAPAGSLEAFYAGFEAGADAFYLGLGDFNARRRAKNFTEKDFIAAAGFAHRHGRKVYVTLNTLVFDSEVPALMDTLSLLEEYRADGVIVQDLGVLALIREHFPSLPLHASTQMFCHNSLGAAFLKEQGVRRIILARELSIAEIGTVMKKVPMDYEVFIHGAMCFSFSGCCLYSSYLYGDSGNRGRCRQPCRLPDGDSHPPLFPFSMKDLAAGDYLKDLVHLGVRALKIEGRLKNAAYVYDTISYYRRCLDRIAGGGAGCPAFSDGTMRLAGPGCFPGADYPRLVETGSPGAVGTAIGEIQRSTPEGLVIGTRVSLQKGMKLRVTDEQGRKLHEGTLLDFKKTGHDRYLWKTIPKRPLRGKLSLYLTGASEVFTGAKRITAVVKTLKHVPAALTVRIAEGRIEAAGTIADMDGFMTSFCISTASARSAPLGEETIRELFLQSDPTPFDPGPIEVSLEKNTFVPFSVLKQARRDFYHDFHLWYNARREEKNAARRHVVLNMQRETPSGEGGEQHLLFGSSFAGRDISRHVPVIEYDRIDDMEQLPPGCCIRLPLFVSEVRLPALRKEVRAMTEKGHRRWMVPSHGWTVFFRECSDVTLIAGPLLYCVNTLAWRELRRLGIALFTVSPDMPDAVTTRRLPGFMVTEGLPEEFMATRLRLPREHYVCAGARLRVERYREYDLVIAAGR